MAESIGITRIPTNEESQDYSQLGTVTPKVAFLAKLAKVELEFVRKHRPFDSQCAKLEYNDEVEHIERESQRKFGYVKHLDVEKLDFGDLKRYGDLKRFTLEEDDEDVEMQNVNNTRTAVVIGHTLKYVCKERGHGCSVFVPMELYNERFGKKKGIEKEE